MVLSDKRILEEMKEGKVVITPFDQKNLSTSSYDVSLGDHYFEEIRGSERKGIYNPYNKDDVDKVWGTEAKQAKQAKEILADTDFKFNGIREDDRIILIAPGASILAHTKEFIGARKSITTMMKARSSMGRNFIEVCKCAGWGDVGYVNRWTMEITNNSRYHHIPLVVGRRIAQIVFLETGEILGDDYTAKGKYQTTGSDSLEALMENWAPASMLPKMYNDRETHSN